MTHGSTKHTRWSTYRIFALQLLAILALISTVVAFALFWPIPYLGIDIDRATAVIVQVSSEGDASPLRVDDRVIRMYDLPWTQVVNHWNLALAIGDRSHPIAIEVERGETVVRTKLLQQSPTLSLQASKLSSLLLALVCWSTGYFLGITRRQDVGGSAVVSVFWLLTAAVFGVYPFGKYLSLPVLVIVQWLASTVLAPLSIYCHVIFPPRLVSDFTKRVWRRGLILVSLALTIAFVSWVALVSPTLLDLTATLSSTVVAVVCLASLASGWLLLRAYQCATLAHTRRQIRLIFVACFAVAVVWTFLVLALEFTDSDTLVVEYISDLVIGLVPIAYLVSGVIPDLYRLDRIAMRTSAFLLSALLIGLVFVSVSALLAPVSPAMTVLIALLAALLYRPLYYFFLRLLPVHWSLERTYNALRQATSKLTATLDAPTIAAILQEGIDRAFQSPACAIYLADNDQDSEVALVCCSGFIHIPSAIPLSELNTMFEGERHISNARELSYQLNHESLNAPAIESLVHNSNIVLWAPLVHTQGRLFGIVLLGHSGNLDPYRSRDLREMQQVFEAASLALTNIWTYRERCLAEETVRQMFGALQEAQEATAAAIAREIHDEVINITMRLNIQALERLLGGSDDPRIRDELQLLVESEHAVVTSLRMVCEQLYPTGRDDPLGLPHVIRQHLEKVESNWSGRCMLQVVGEQVELPTTVQREIFRVVREAVTNATKHADAETITVALSYERGGTALHIVIGDDGRSGQAVSIKPGHWGIRGMYESAVAIQGELSFHCTKSGGTLVTLTVPIVPDIAPTATILA